MRTRDQLIRVGATIAIVAGWAWIAKFAVITTRDAGFEPVESVAYLIGLLGPIAGATAYVALRGWKLALAVPIALGAMVATVAVGAAIQALFASIYGGQNLGGTEEVGILVTGVAWVGAGLALKARSPEAGAAQYAS